MTGLREQDLKLAKELIAKRDAISGFLKQIMSADGFITMDISGTRPKYTGCVMDAAMTLQEPLKAMVSAELLEARKKIVEDMTNLGLVPREDA